MFTKRSYVLTLLAATLHSSTRFLPLSLSLSLLFFFLPDSISVSCSSRFSLFLSLTLWLCVSKCLPTGGARGCRISACFHTAVHRGTLSRVHTPLIPSVPTPSPPDRHGLRFSCECRNFRCLFVGAACIQNVPPFTRFLSVAPLSTPRRQVCLEIARDVGKRRSRVGGEAKCRRGEGADERKTLKQG